MTVEEAEAAPPVEAEALPAEFVVSDSRTVFRAFEASEFVPWPSWDRLVKILRANGGTFGLCGPRGAGKSWLMLRAIHDAREEKREDNPVRRRGLGVWYPSPSEAEPSAFLASLSLSFANELESVIKSARSRNPFARLVQKEFFYRATIVLGVLVALWLEFFEHLTHSSYDPKTSTVHTHDTKNWVYAVAIAAGGVAFLWLLRSAIVSMSKSTRLLKEAQIARERARYSTTLRASSEYGADAGARGITGKWTRSQEQELIERPVTLSVLVSDFRSLATHASGYFGRVVVAIDELDKMADPKEVKELLRNIKGVFDLPGVHFLVSVSDEAARSLNLGALTGRSEFNSTFNTVIELPPISPSASADLLDRRASVNVDIARALSVLAGGNPREIIRLAEAVGEETHWRDAVLHVLADEASNLRREIVTALDEEGRPQLTQDARIGSYNAIDDRDLDDVDRFADFASAAIDRMWDPLWNDEEWRRRFQEPWQRLAIRLTVGAELLQGPLDDEERLLQLRDVIVAASESAAVGRIIFEQRIRVDTRVSA